MDRKAILKALTLSFLPIVVYIVVEAEYGPIPGMAAAFAWSLLEMGWIRFKENRIEKLLLVDVGLIAFLGGVAILFSDPFFFKLKPAIFEAVFLIIIGLSVWGGAPIIQSMTKRQIGATGLEVNFEHPQFRKMMIGMFWLMAVHVLAIVWAAYFASTELWGFISGAVLYIIMGIWVAGQILPRFLKPLYWRFKYSQDEWFPVIDRSSGKVIFHAPRKVVHRSKEWLHPVVHINIFNKNNWWYLQRRSLNKDLYPGFWDVSIGGHVQKGETIKAAGEREASEELGLKIVLNDKPQYSYQIQLDNELELVNVYLIKTDTKPVPNSDELAGGQFWNPIQIRKALDREKFTPSLKTEFDFLEKNGFFQTSIKAKKKKKARRK